jgi:TonB-dependent SusC/RagA subfamily outer membrane receptor
MKKICLLLIFCLSAVYSFSQTSQQPIDSAPRCNLGKPGVSSMPAAPEPLLLVDGVRKTFETVYWHINPNDIATINVLRDSAAIAKYGIIARGGVIIITTKRKVVKSK